MARTKKAMARRRRHEWMLYFPPEDRSRVERLARYESARQERRVSASEVLRVLARQRERTLDTAGKLASV